MKEQSQRDNRQCASDVTALGQAMAQAERTAIADDWERETRARLAVLEEELHRRLEAAN